MSFFLDIRNALLIVAGISLSALAAAFIAQYGFDLAPCKLCIYQRWPYGIVAILALISVFFLPGRTIAAMVLLLCAALLLADTAIAAYHVGVEQKWWEGPSGCSASTTGAMSLEELEKQIMATDPVRCDDIAWSLFGISMAGYNVLLTLALAGYCLLVFAKRKQT